MPRESRRTPRVWQSLKRVKIPGYRIVDKIARGGMGTVYRAKRVRDGRDCAVKVLHDNLAEQEESVKRFFREAKALESLKHPNIVEFLDAGKTPDGRVYIAMEYISGQTLADVVRAQGPLPLDLALGLLSEVCAAVSAAHASGVIHRDLTPQNVILVNKRQVKLVDFGIAKRANSHTQITSAGMVMGTPGFLSPEQITGNTSVEPSSDVYALGALLYLCLSGEKPYTAATAQGILGRQVTEPPNRLDTAALHIPDALAQVVNRALARTPSERFQSVDAFREAMLAAGDRPLLSQPELQQRMTQTLAQQRATLVPGASFGAPAKRTTVTLRMPTLASSRRWIGVMLVGFLTVAAAALWFATQEAPQDLAVAEGPVLLGFSGDESLRQGIALGLRSVNDEEGGVGGRPLQLASPDAKVVALVGLQTIDLWQRDRVLFGAVNGSSEHRFAPLPKTLFFYRPALESEVKVLVKHVLDKVTATQVAVVFDQADEECGLAAIRIVAKLGSQARDDVAQLKPEKAKAVLRCNPLRASIGTTTIATQVVPALESSAAIVQSFKKHAPADASALMLEGYVTARLLAMALKLAGPNASTQELINAIEKMHHIELGTGVPLGFSPTQHVASRGVWLVEGNRPVAGPLFDD